MPAEAVPSGIAPVNGAPAPSPGEPGGGAPSPTERARLAFRLTGELRKLVASMRPLPLLLAGAYAVHRGDSLPAAVVREPDRARSLVLALLARGLASREADVHFVTPTRPLLGSPVVRERAVVRAQRRGEPADIYLVDARRSPEAHLIDIAGLYNLTSTSAADEQELVVNDDRAAWVIAQDGAITSVQYADIRGEPHLDGPGWNRWSRIQNTITNYQETGQGAGVGRRSFKLDPAAYRVVLGLSSGALLVDADAHKIRIPTTGTGRIEGAEYVRDQTQKKARPGNLVTWAVDRVRALPWFGDENMQYLKAVAFKGADQFEQIVGTVTGDDGASAVAEELGQLYAAPTAKATDPETGWPPMAMEPMHDPPLKGEGKWVDLGNDLFLQKLNGAPSPFVFSFIRTDRERRYSQVYVTLWDPRQVELDMVSGTVEPRSATGETGPGIVPREPRLMRRFVAAFNGGFQAVHGEFGMMANKVAYLPPKPFAATVARLADGSTGFGTWPEAARPPENIVSYRQNMTPLMVDEVINPYKRHWWGGVPPGWTEESRTVRSGLCMTKDGFVGYFYGDSVDPDVLALAMQRARCSYGVHLDMNPGHTGLEFYRVAPVGSLVIPKRRLEELWEARGPVPDLPGWEFLARRMIKYMALMNFPRYLNTESRDFFYLTLRELLPGPEAPTAITPAEEGEGAWRTQGLPQHGWPYAVATTNVRAEAARPYTRVGLIKVDPKFVRLERPGDIEPRRILEFRSTIAEGPSALWHSETLGFRIGSHAPEPSASRITGGIPAEAPEAARASAALGIDRAGMLLYARVTEGPAPGKDGTLLLSLLTRMGCDKLILLPRPLGADMVNDHAVVAAAGIGEQVTLIRTEGPGVRQIFSDTPIVLPKKWAPLQQKRVREK